MKLRTLYISLLLCSVPLTAGDELKIVANPSIQITGITGQELRAIYLGEVTSLNHGRPVYPVLNRAKDVFGAFASQYLGKSKTALETYYRSLIFTGKWSMPPSFPGDAEVVGHVSRTPGAIGFIRGSSPAGNLVTVRVSD